MATSLEHLDDFPVELRKVLESSQTDIQPYLSTLLDLPLVQLQKEPRLQKERELSAGEALQQLACDNYGVLLQASKDVSFVRNKVIYHF